MWLLPMVIQTLLVMAYTYAAIAFLTTDAGYFSEEAPPTWSWPAVIVVGVGYVPALVCLAVALADLASPDLRADRSQWRLLAVTTGASVAMLLVMATPPGWHLFDWYVA
jgi:hypothetical protein